MTKSMTFAITVDQYYLNKLVLAIKLMSIVRTKTGVLIWSTKYILYTHTELSKLAPMAAEYAVDNNIPYIYGLKQGLEVVLSQQQIIEKHFGSKLSELI